MQRQISQSIINISNIALSDIIVKVITVPVLTDQGRTGIGMCLKTSVENGFPGMSTTWPRQLNNNSTRKQTFIMLCITANNTVTLPFKFGTVTFLKMLKEVYFSSPRRI